MEDEEANLPIDYTVVPYQELVSLSEAKESLEKQLADMEAQVSKLQKPESLEPTPAASPAMTGPEGEGGMGVGCRLVKFNSPNTEWWGKKCNICMP